MIDSELFDVFEIQTRTEEYRDVLAQRLKHDFALKLVNRVSVIKRRHDRVGHFQYLVQ